MKKIIYSFLILLIISINFISFAEATIEADSFTEEEIIWINNHKDIELNFGLDPLSGMDYFDFQNEKNGYILDVVELIRNETGLNITIIGDKTWNDVYTGLHSKSIDILFGANETEERLKLMSFTTSVYSNPYAVFVKKDGDVKTIGDLNNKIIAFIDGDIAIELFQDYYTNLNLEIETVYSQVEGLRDLQSSKIDGFITVGGGIEYDFIYNYDNISHITNLNQLTSDMTLSTRIEDRVLRDILQKIIDRNKETINQYINSSKIKYNQKIMNLTYEEIKYIESGKKITFGITSDYLPFEYYDGKSFSGIDGIILDEITSIIGLKFDYVYDDFNTLYNLALDGKVDMLNIAKSPDREDFFIFTEPLSQERDRIYGKNTSKYISNIYELQGKRIAVIEGFWHDVYLKLNLQNIIIIKTKNIMESLKLLSSGKVDYLIENPTVTEFYVTGLGYNDILGMGTTSKDSFLYFGLVKNEHVDTEIITSIINKTMILIDYNKLKQVGVSSVPELTRINEMYLFLIVCILVLVLIVIGLILYKLINVLITEKEESAVLREREHLMFIDPLTGLNNRLYFDNLEPLIDYDHFPQCFIISDLDCLKRINDTYGHHMGDEYIKEYAKILKELELNKTVCRMGGDEFLIYCENCDQTMADYIIDTIREKAEKTSIKFGENSIDGVYAALGYYIREKLDEPVYKCVIYADNNMYVDKKKRKRDINFRI